jgi:hypothetical protein
VEKMRAPGAKGAPTAKAFKESAKTAKKWQTRNAQLVDQPFMTQRYAKKS